MRVLPNASGFSSDKVNARGKTTKKYDSYRTPFEKLLFLKNPAQFLKPGITLESLETIAKAQTDNTAAQQLQIAKATLSDSIRKC